jgi:hypothetical protein
LGEADAVKFDARLEAAFNRGNAAGLQMRLFQTKVPTDGSGVPMDSKLLVYARLRSGRMVGW